ncbi:MAG: hypothetical protein LBR26_17560, partial [Prevotella sp.]|nr:hypothetical protein [Prevotella sp.]
GDGSPEAGVTDDGEFGLKVSYSINGSPDRDAYIQFCDITDPVVATEGVTFEIGRQYVLNLTFGAGSGSVDDPDPDINIGARISFEDLDVDPYPDNIQAPAPPRFKPAPAIWSQSNIYYDNTLDGNPNDEVGALTFSEEEDGKNLYQGVSFKWGSLIGVSSYNGYLSSGHLFIPDSNGKYYKVAILDLENWADDGGVVATFKNTYFGSIVWSDLSKYDDDGNNARIALWNAIPYTDLANISSYVTASPPGRTARDNNGLTEASGTAALPYTTYKGDICKYLVDKKTANGNANTLTDGLKWRLPTSNEFGLLVAGSHANDDDTRDFVIGDYITRWKSDDSNGGTVNTGSNPENGKNEMSSGGYSFYTLDYVVDGTAKPSFPASGTRFNFAYMFETSYNGGNYWSSSVYTEWSAYGLGFTSSYVNPGTYGLKGIGCNVRCVHSY